jgi:hypothetical protein
VNASEVAAPGHLQPQEQAVAIVGHEALAAHRQVPLGRRLEGGVDGLAAAQELVEPEGEGGQPQRSPTALVSNVRNSARPMTSRAVMRLFGSCLRRKKKGLPGSIALNRLVSRRQKAQRWGLVAAIRSHQVQ